MKTVKTFTVDRKTWFRGKGGECSRLVTATNKRCCLGFLGLACGIEEESMDDVASPDGVDATDMDKWPEGLLSGVDLTDECVGIINTNDVEDLSEAEREAELRNRFADIGITIRFKN